MHYFSSPTSNILPSTFAPASVAMSRSDSRDSATSTTSYTSQQCAWDIRPRSSSSFYSSPHSSNSTTTHTTNNHHPSAHRRTSSSSSSSSNWTPSPYRSCLSQACETSSSTSYLSDDDLLDLPIDVIDAPVQKELSTEEQIEMLRAYREREEACQHAHRLHAAKPEIWAHHQHVQLAQQQQQQQQQKKTARIVRFAGEQGARTSWGEGDRRV